MKRLTCFSVLGSYSIGFELEYETTVPAFIERLMGAGVKIDKVKLREKAEKDMRTVHGLEYPADAFLRDFDSIDAMAADVVYNIRCKKEKAEFSVFMKNNTSKVSVLTGDYDFDLGAILEKGKGM